MQVKFRVGKMQDFQKVYSVQMFDTLQFSRTNGFWLRDRIMKPQNNKLTIKFAFFKLKGIMTLDTKQPIISFLPPFLPPSLLASFLPSFSLCVNNSVQQIYIEGIEHTSCCAGDIKLNKPLLFFRKLTSLHRRQTSIISCDNCNNINTPGS